MQKKKALKKWTKLEKQKKQTLKSGLNQLYQWRNAVNAVRRLRQNAFKRVLAVEDADKIDRNGNWDKRLRQNESDWYSAEAVSG